MNGKHYYLISKQDYMNNIADKMALYYMVKHLAFHVKLNAPKIGAGNSLLNAALRIETHAQELFDTWGVPKDYLFAESEEDIAGLMEKQLIDVCDQCCCPYCDECCEDDPEESDLCSDCEDEYDNDYDYDCDDDELFCKIEALLENIADIIEDLKADVSQDGEDDE